MALVDVIIGYAKGAQGDVGPQGPIGPQGPEGPMGPQGPAGPTTALINNATTVTPGEAALDAAMGKTLQDQIDKNNNSLDIVRYFKNKKILILGDSISDESVNAPNWVTNFKNRLTGIATVTNNSVSGRKMIELPTVTSGLTYDYDIVIIFLGTNDHNNAVPLGNYGSNPTTNYTDAIRQSFENINNGGTKKPIIYFITPLWTNNDTSFWNLECYRKGIIGFCKRWGLKFINGANFPALSDYYTTYYMPDNLHPNAAYAPIMADYIINKLICGGDSDYTNQAFYHNISSKLTSNFSGSAKYFFNSTTLKIVINGNLTISSTGKSTAILTGLTGLLNSIYVVPYSSVALYRSSDDTMFNRMLYVNGDDLLLRCDDLTTGVYAIHAVYELDPTWCNLATTT